jgi:hypothetical protein
VNVTEPDAGDRVELTVVIHEPLVSFPVSVGGVQVIEVTVEKIIH